MDPLEGLATVTRSQGMMGSRAEPGHWELLWEVGPPATRVQRELTTAATEIANHRDSYPLLPGVASAVALCGSVGKGG